DITFDLPNLPAWKLVIDPRFNDVYLGTDVGVFKLPSGGMNWFSSNPALGPNQPAWATGLPNVQVKDMELNLQLNTLTAGTYGRSMYQIFLDDVQADSG